MAEYLQIFRFIAYRCRLYGSFLCFFRLFYVFGKMKKKGMGGLSLKHEPLKNKTKLLSSYQLILFKERRI